mmetsp:Transcript_27904/g.62941  ORF Transcript_27904/g.62941 Transcript_27904/m.62941 type:complete len:101 (-) Transcript_27904:1012-1314(-)
MQFTYVAVVDVHPQVSRLYVDGPARFVPAPRPPAPLRRTSPAAAPLLVGGRGRLATQPGSMIRFFIKLKRTGSLFTWCTLGALTIDLRSTHEVTTTSRSR